MTRPVEVLDVAVVLAALVLIANQNGETRPGRAAFKQAGENLGRVGLIALRDDVTLPRPPPIEIDEQVLDAECDPGRNAINNDHIRRPVTFARRRDSKRLSK